MAVVTADASTFVRRPTPASSALAVVVGVVAVALVADAAVQRRILGVTVGGIVGFALGVGLWRRGRPLAGGLLAVVGSVVVLYGLVLAGTQPRFDVHRLELLPGLLGAWILAAGVAPVRLGWERRLVTIGTGLVFLAVLTSGVVQTAPLSTLLVAGALTILSWDAGENSVSLGNHVGTRAPSGRAEAVHSLASGLVAAVAVLLALSVHRLGVDGLPLAALAALLVAGVVLTLVYYR